MSQKIPTLDGMRAASIVLVLAAHLLPLGPKSLSLNGTVAAMGMAIFFSLSGFLITQNLINGQPLGTFFIRRGARILPLAYLYLLVIFTVSPHYPTWTVIQNVLFVQNYTYAWMLDGHFWSLCVEVHFYITIGLLVLAFGIRGALLIPAACVAVTLIRIWHGAFIDIQTHLRVDEICIGACVAIASHYGVFERRSATPSAFIGALLMLAAASWPDAGWTQYFRPYCAGALLSLAIILRHSLIRRALVSRTASYVARISYALYVIHPITTLGFMDAGPVYLKYLVLRPISIAATFVLAHISTFYYESRFIEIAKNFRIAAVRR
jgi:peptidoglycan/LPS O-acetylase OafA/YrhL